MALNAQHLVTINLFGSASEMAKLSKIMEHI